MPKDVIIACDFSDRASTLNFLNLFEKEKPFLKIGMELFYAAGGSIVREIKDRGHKVFLDLKLHDIPNTVSKAMSVLSRLSVDMVNVHSAGGIKMMQYAKEGLTRPDGSCPILIAVTQLTSTSETMMRDELLIDKPLVEIVRHYAQNTLQAGLNGIVCSPHEAKAVHQLCGEQFLTITPGIRFADSKQDDQERITTPAKARELGSDYIVVGRPITQAKDPVEAYRKCIDQFIGKNT